MLSTLPRALTAIGVVAATLAMFSGATHAQSSSPCSKRYSQAWQIPLTSSDVGKSIGSVLKRSSFDLVKTEGLNRMSIGRAPDGTVGIQINIPRGENVKNGFYLDPLGSRGVDAACLSVRVYLQNGFEWPKQGGGTKMAWGLWGGEPRNLGGGTPASQQQGWSVRNVNSIWGFGLYSYNLNRSSKHGQYGDRLDRWGSSNWQAGRWHTIEMEVVLNNPGRANGYAQVWLNGKSRRTMTDLVFRNNTNWAIRGLMAQDMWGGNTDDPKNFSPKSQRMWYANYELFTSRGSQVAQNTPPSNNIPSNSGSGGATNQPTSGGSSGLSNSNLRQNLFQWRSSADGGQGVSFLDRLFGRSSTNQ